MSHTPCVTVFIPVYNGQEFIGDAISSILNQTYQDFRLLIINDGSTDDTESIIRKHRDPRLKLVNHIRNQGIPYTRNHGLELAEGDYLALMDADDIASPNRLSDQIRFLEKNKDVGVCGSWYKKATGTKIETVKFPELHKEIIFNLLFDNCFGQNTVMLRRSLIERYSLRYDTDFSLSEDYNYWVRCSRHMQLANIPLEYITYRFHPNNSSNRFHKEMIQYADRARILHLENFDIHPDETELNLHLDLLNFRFIGDFNRLNRAGEWLSTLANAVLIKTGLPPHLVYATLARYWYSACGHAAENGHKVWRLFNTFPMGTHASLEWQIKLFLRTHSGFRIK